MGEPGTATSWLSAPLFTLLLGLAILPACACKVDLSDRWNFRDVVHLPLGEVRERFGIPPLAAVGARQEAA
ncbi:hypothetical protein WMF40_39940 [Sorangium sp. So ce854]